MLVEKSARTVFTPLDDGTGVLLNVDTLYYYSINRTGVVLWKEIDAHSPSTLENLIQVVFERFEIDRDVARQETTSFVEKLKALNLLRSG
jgi:hypothetical protein